MANITVDAKMLCKAFLAGAKSIEARKEYINELNVFPVPDGDTGTNMTLTIMSAAKEVSQMENPTMKELAKAITTASKALAKMDISSLATVPSNLEEEKSNG